MNAQVLTQPNAWDLLESWLNESADRCVHTMNRINGRWTFSLQGEQVYSSVTQVTLDSAIRSALMVAYSNGER